MGDDEGPEGPEDLHAVLLTIAWFGLENIGLWAIFFRFYRFAIMVHIGMFGLCSMMMIAGVCIMLQFQGAGTITEDPLHHTIGFIVFLLLPLILISGAVCKTSQASSYVSAKKVSFGNMAHTIFGWFIILLVKLPVISSYLEEGEALGIIIIVVDVISYSAYMYLKFYGKKMEAVLQSDTYTDLALRAVKSEEDLNIYGGNYFIFANYVYSIEPVLDSHPGGWEIISKTKGREVDRFIYGMQMVELIDGVDRVSHRSLSLNLAGNPIARIDVPCPYDNMNDLNKVKVHELYKNDANSNIYIVYFESIDTEFKWKGYSDLAQIGQYYAISIDEKKARLYTTVNFLQKQNLELMADIVGGFPKLIAVKQQIKEDTLNSITELE